MLLATLQLADSFFPTGAYAHSQGLEGMVAHGWVSNSAEVKEYLTELLMGAVLPSDGVALLNAHRSAAKADPAAIREIDRRLHAMKLPEKMRLASTQSGRRFLDESLALLVGSPVPSVFEQYRSDVVAHLVPGSASVAFAISAWAVDIEAAAALYAFCHSFAVGVLGAAQRLLPMTHGEAQQILRSLHDPIAAGAEEIGGRHWRDMISFTPQADIASMRHQHADVRMFAS